MLTKTLLGYRLRAYRNELREGENVQVDCTHAESQEILGVFYKNPNFFCLPYMENEIAKIMREKGNLAEYFTVVIVAVPVFAAERKS